MATRINIFEARQGERSGRMTVVPAISVFLVVAGFGASYGYEQLSAPQQGSHEAVNASGR